MMFRRAVLERLILLVFLFSLVAFGAERSCAAVSPDASPAPTSAKPAAQAQAGDPVQAFPPEVIRARSEELQKLLDALNASTPEKETVSDDLYSRRLFSLGTLHSLYGRLASQLGLLEKTKKELEQIKAENETQAMVDGKPPYALSAADGVHDRIDDLRLQKASVTAASSYIDASLESLREQIRKGDHSLQGANSSAAASPSEAWEYALAREGVENLRVDAALKITIRSIAKLRTEIIDLSLNRQNVILEKIKKELAFSQEDLDKQVSLLQSRIDEVRASLPKMQEERIRAERQLFRAQSDLESARDDRKKKTAQSVAAEKDAWFSYWQGKVDRSEQEVLFLAEAQKIWRSRYAILNDDLKNGEVWKIRGDAQSRLKGFETMLVSVQNEQSRTNAALVAARKEMDGVPEDRDLPAHYRSRRDALTQTAEDLVNFASRMTTVFTLNTRLLSEIDDTLNALRLAERVTTMGKEKILGFLNARLWSDDGYDITVLKLIVSIILFVFGFTASRSISSGFRRFVLNRFDLDPTKSMMIQSVFFVFLVFVFLMVALDIINVPITAFAFIGGALALGIGVGAQNLFSNLISGFILMFSKPFRINDVIDVDGVTATVEEIGARSTSIKTFDNVDVVVPNSYFLDHKITNWTLTDQKIRLKIAVGVAYGSDVREVERLLVLAASEHSRVLKTPDPFVVFQNFGASALEFTLFFWIDMANASTLKVPSDIRFRLVALFERAGISIAYPQMDIHLSGMKPVDLRIVETLAKEGNPHDSDTPSRTDPVDSDGSGEDPKPLRLP